MSKIGNYSRRKLEAIICELIGKAHGTRGCFEFDSSGGTDPDVPVIQSSGIQTITSGDARIDNSFGMHFGPLAIGEGAVLSITEPYGTLEIV